MTRNVLAALFTFALVAGFVAPADARPVLNPQLGATWTNMSFDDDVSLDAESGQVGFLLGGTVRLGGKLGLIPGIYYQKTAFEATETDDITFETITDVVGISSVHVPVYVGYKIGAMGTGLRFYAGPSVTFITGVDDNAFGASTDDFESSIFGGVLGAGFDLSTITFDLNYEIGLSDATNQDLDLGGKQNVLRGLIGIKI